MTKITETFPNSRLRLEATADEKTVVVALPSGREKTLVFGEVDEVTGGIEIPGVFSAQVIEAVNGGPFAEFLSSGRRKLAWWGDSTTEAMSQSIQYDWAVDGEGHFRSMPGVTLHKNFGGNGASIEYIRTASDDYLNSGNVACNPEMVGAACVDSGYEFAMIFSFGLNDFRVRTDIAGAYANATMLQAVQDFQADVVDCVRRFRAVAGRVPILFRVPNTVTLTGAYLSSGNGFTGQHCTDALRLAYLGDPAVGIAPLDALIGRSLVVDIGGIIFGDKSWALASRPMHITDDGLHPNSQGYSQVRALIGIYMQSSGARFDRAFVDAGVVQTSGPNYTDLQFCTLSCKHAYGASAGVSNYGDSIPPVLGTGDRLDVITPNGEYRRVTVTNAPYQNAADYYIRWAGAGIDGAWHESDVPSGSTFTLSRRRIGSLWELIARRRADAGVPVAIYRFRVEEGSSGSVTIRALPDADSKSLADRAPTAADYIALASIGANFDVMQGMHGLPLTGATITPQSDPGLFVISLAGKDFSAAVGQFGAIIVP